MPNHIYKHIEITGTSGESMEAAVQNAVARAAQPITAMLRNGRSRSKSASR